MHHNMVLSEHPALHHCYVTMDIEKLSGLLRDEFPHADDRKIQKILALIASNLSDPQHKQPGVTTFGDGRQTGDIAADSLDRWDGVNSTIEVTNDSRIEGAAVGVNLGTITIILGYDSDDATRHRVGRYLSRLADRLYKLRLRGLDPGVRDTDGVPLPNIYVQLAVQDEVELARGRPEDLRPYFQNHDLRLSVIQTHDPDWALPRQAVLRVCTPDVEPGGEVLHQLPAERPILPTKLVLTRARLVIEVVEQYRQLVLLGDPGSGKSTFLAHLAWTITQQHLQPHRRSGAYKQQPEFFHTLPILLSLRTLSTRLAHGEEPDTIVFQALLDVISEQGDLDLEDLLRTALYRGTALLLFDGLDEVPLEGIAGVQASRDATVRAVRSFTQRYAQTPAVLTCRTRAFDKKLQAALRWPTTTIALWTLGQIRVFVELWYGAQVADGLLDREQADELRQELIAAIESSQRLRRMAGTPLLMTIMALVLRHKGRLPRDRPNLYERILDLLLGEWDAARQVESLAKVVGLHAWDTKEFRPIVDQLSYQAHLLGHPVDGRGRLAASAIREAFARFFRDMDVPEPWVKADRSLQYIDQRSGLLVPDNNDAYVFAHLTLQEYCAGHYMAEYDDMETRVLYHRDDDRWREPIKLGMGVAHKALLNSVLHALVARQEHGVDKPRARWYRDLLLVAEIGEDRDWNRLRGSGALVKVDNLQQQLRAGIEKLLRDSTQPIPFDERYRAAEYLAALGDLRVPVAPTAYTSRAYVRDRPYWCCALSSKMAERMYPIGGWESPVVEWLHLSPFFITCYPITVSQFAVFLSEGYSPSAQQWWTKEGWTWKMATHRIAPDNWSLGHVNQPVVGVTWYEATAFATWLNKHIQRIRPNYCARLPTEAEWEIAAVYQDTGMRRTYPWGEDPPTIERAVFDVSQLSHPPPVGLCPSGASSCGALDMAGTVGELVASPYHPYPQQSDHVVKDFEPGDQNITIRGGSFRRQAAGLQCNARGRTTPDRSFDSVGFRLVLVKTISPKPRPA